MKLIKYSSPGYNNDCLPDQHNGFAWVDRHNVPQIADDEGDPAGKVTQNSPNFIFPPWHDLLHTGHGKNTQSYTTGPNPFGPGQFDVVLSVEGHHTKKTVLHVVFDVVDPYPTP